MKKYINTRLANLLIDELEDSAVVTQLGDHFVTLLPETNREEVCQVLKRLKSAAEEKLGLKLKVGVSTFPDRAVTFETLLEQAEAEMMQQSPHDNRHIGLISSEVKQMSSTEVKKMSSAQL
jgi:GGDEF domain-containing protein